MATKAKRTRAVDTAAGAVKAMLNAAQPLLTPPAHCAMRSGDAPFWKGVIEARARDEWTESNLVIAAQLARCQFDIEDQQKLLYSEGHVVVNERGTPIANPRHTVLEKLRSSQMMLMRSLALVGSDVARGRDLAGKRKLEQESRKLRGELEENSLLA